MHPLPICHGCPAGPQGRRMRPQVASVLSQARNGGPASFLEAAAGAVQAAGDGAQAAVAQRLPVPRHRLSPPVAAAKAAGTIRGLLSQSDEWWSARRCLSGTTVPLQAMEQLLSWRFREFRGRPSFSAAAGTRTSEAATAASRAPWTAWGPWSGLSTSAARMAALAA